MSEPLIKHPPHGGQLHVYEEHYQIPTDEWLDLSTGINPNGYPVPPFHENMLRDLPNDNDGLTAIAGHYYGCENVLMVPGSSWAIQQLPFALDYLYPKIKTVLLPRIGYKEHEKAWSVLPRNMVFYEDVPTDIQLESCDVCVFINPNNPTAHLLDSQLVIKMAEKLMQSEGLLIVDEAFMDAVNQYSVAGHKLKNVIVLRSLGKFFGLAGLRVGSVIANESILKQLTCQLPPWSISHPARYISKIALQDTHWIHQTKLKLAELSMQLKNMCERLLLPVFDDCKVVSNPLFVSVWFDSQADAIGLHHLLCKQGILTRLLDEQSGIRIGLTKNSDTDFQRLNKAMAQAVQHFSKEITVC